MTYVQTTHVLYLPYNLNQFGGKCIVKSTGDMGIATRSNSTSHVYTLLDY